jgi:hypothetical protein
VKLSISLKDKLFFFIFNVSKSFLLNVVINTNFQNDNKTNCLITIVIYNHQFLQLH